jgi:HK97 family phage portal protein
MFNFLSSLPSLSSLVPRFTGRLRRAIPVTAEPSIPVYPAEPRDLDAYAGSSWVYVAVSRIAEAGALVPLHVYKRAGEGRVAVENHPLELLLERPNPFLSGFELIEQTLGVLELTGNAYWYLAGDGGTPTEIWPLRPDRVAVVPHPERHIAGYLYEAGGVRVPLAPEEVVHFKRWHPSNDYTGLSPVSAARIAIDGDRAMAQWNRAAFGEDRGVPAGIVSINEYVSDSDFERIKREWRASYGGGQRRTAFLRGGGIEWKSIGLSHTDLDFLSGRKAHRDEILSIFGVPVGLIDANATEANATVAERQFIERTLYPKLVRLAQKITRDLLPFWGDHYIAAFDDIRPTDAAARIAEIGAARGILTPDELRARFYQLPPLAPFTLPPSKN